MNTLKHGLLKVEYITRDYLKRIRNNGLIQFLLNRILDNSVVILEGSLNPLLQSELLMEIFNYTDMQFFGVDIKTIKKFSKREITIIYPRRKDWELDIRATIDYLSLVVKA